MDTSGRIVLNKEGTGKQSYSQFTKGELAEVLKFGAEELFKETDEEQNTSQELDIDQILARAETASSTQQSANPLSSSFKVANFSVSTGNKRGKKEEKDDFWQKVIPEGVRVAHEKEKLYLPPRRRKQVKHYFEQQADENSQKSSKKKKDKKKSTGFNIKETRAFIKSFKKFADLKKIDLVLKDCNLSEKKKIEEAEEFAKQLIEECKKSIPEQNESTKKKSKSIMITFNNVQVNSTEILQRIEQINALNKKFKIYGDNFKDCRLPDSIKPVRNWPCSWSERDDINLLRGILRHGIGNWEDIRLDAELKLSKKICPAETDSNRKVKANHLQRRVDQLLVSIEQEVKDEEETLKEMRTSRKSQRKPKISQSDLKKTCEIFLKPIAHVLKQFSEMNDDEGMSKTERLNRIKQYLMIIGTKIEEIVEENSDIPESDLRKTLWHIVHKRAKTTGDATTLQTLYNRLVAKQSQEAAAAQNSEEKKTKKSSQKKKSPKPKKSYVEEDDEEDSDYETSSSSKTKKSSRKRYDSDEEYCPPTKKHKR